MRKRKRKKSAGPEILSRLQERGKKRKDLAISVQNLGKRSRCCWKNDRPVRESFRA